jgi:hypothetical protein
VKFEAVDSANCGVAAADYKLAGQQLPLLLVLSELLPSARPPAWSATGRSATYTSADCGRLTLHYAFHCTWLQVSQHPSVSAAHAENESFTYDIVSAPATKFMGNTLEVYPKGKLQKCGALPAATRCQVKFTKLLGCGGWCMYEWMKEASGNAAVESQLCQGWWGAIVST